MKFRSAPIEMMSELVLRMLQNAAGGVKDELCLSDLTTMLARFCRASVTPLTDSYFGLEIALRPIPERYDPLSIPRTIMHRMFLDPFARLQIYEGPN